MKAGKAGAALAMQPIASGTESFLAGTVSCRIQVHGNDELYKEYKMQVGDLQLWYDGGRKALGP